MYIGGGITLLVLGGILAFGVSDRVSGLDLQLIGYILMAGGALAIVLSLVLNAQRNNTSHTEVVERRGTPPRDPRYVDEGRDPRSVDDGRYVEERRDRY
jgi:hypothetical protein